MPDDDLRRELADLAKRMARIERRLGMQGDVPSPDERAADEAVPSVPPVIAREGSLPKESPTPPAVVEDGPSSPVPPPVIAAEVPTSAESPAAPPTQPTTTAALRRAAAERRPTFRERADAVWPAAERPQTPRSTTDGPQRSWEALIGGKWMGWLGALVIIIGTALLAAVLDVASYWGGLPAGVKCTILALFGGGLLGAGEFVYRKIGKIASIGLFAAGIGTLYVTAYATFGWYHILSEVGAFLLLGGVAAGGFAITWRTRALAIGVLSVIGGHLAPILLSGGATFAAALPLYLTALLAVGLLLSAMDATTFRPLRYVSMAALAFVATWWVLPYPQPWALFLVFGAGWWAMVLADAVVAALREQSKQGNAIGTLLGTAWYVTVTCWLLWTGPAGGEGWMGFFTAAIAVLAAATALQFGPGLDSVRQRPESAIDALAVSLWIQAAILVPVAIALQFDGFGQSVAWLAVGLGSVEAGRRLRARSIEIFGLIVGALAVARIAVVDSWWASAAMRHELLNLPGVTVTGWSVLAVVAVGAVGITAHRLSPPWRKMNTALMAISTLGWMSLCVIQCGPLTGTAGWLIGAAALVFVRRLDERTQAFAFGRLLLVAAMLKWVLFDLALMRADSGWSAGDMLPFVNGQMLLGIALGAVAWWTYKIQEASQPVDAEGGGSILVLTASPLRLVVQFFPVVMAGLILWGLSFEVDRLLVLWRTSGTDGSASPWTTTHLLGLWVTLLWAVGGVAMFLIGRARRIDILCPAGFVVLAGSIIAWLGFDTLYFRGEIGPVLDRIVLNPQFLVGVLLIGLLAGFQFLYRRLEPEQLPSALPREIVQPVTMALIGLVGLWLGSLEIDRFFAGEASPNAAMARQTGLSVFWGIYGIGVVIVGFRRAARIVRYTGLALLGVTFLKVALIDTSQLVGVYRPLSLIAIGLLFVVTSIGYARLSPALLGRSDEDSSDSNDDPSDVQPGTESEP